MYDTNKNGQMDEHEFKRVLVDLGRRDITDQQVKQMLQENDENGDGFLQWDEFIEVVSVE